ncbi:MAG: Tm-1-like ATP-binding domain-containing protein [Thiothrix sp.]|nr:Tm-1-like ATP-binding domain-containing protein [Thiothrix sp.]HPQ94621.1 Tm-1-like ATP-binding domain-containing protein [Thiolinea sp.]
MDKTILLIGTYDTKADELSYLQQCIEGQGARCLRMDVSVLGETDVPCEHDKQAVAAAAGVTIAAVIASGDENSAMQLMAQGAASLTRQLWEQRRFDGMLAIGGSMATDLALDVVAALPLGVPKFILSTIAFSALIPAERIAADVQMMLWAGGLYGLNSVCKASLSQAAGAVVGATRAVEPPRTQQPLIGMTSLGKSCLSYMVGLKPALEQRGFEVAVFHATGMGGRAFESLAAQGRFAIVLDFCTQELANWVHGSSVNAGNDRLLNAGRAGIPQLVAPGAMDLVDLPAWQPLPPSFGSSPYHAHNRLIGSVVMSAQERVRTVQVMAERLAAAQAPVRVLLPRQGIEAWDRPGQELYAPADLTAYLAALQDALGQAGVAYEVLDCHINDPAFVARVLAIVDEWREAGVVAEQ